MAVGHAVPCSTFAMLTLAGTPEVEAAAARLRIEMMRGNDLIRLARDSPNQDGAAVVLRNYAAFLERWHRILKRR
jgi:hypothetical protein